MDRKSEDIYNSRDCLKSIYINCINMKMEGKRNWMPDVSWERDNEIYFSDLFTSLVSFSTIKELRKLGIRYRPYYKGNKIHPRFTWS